jgi:hypothetical protein
MHNTPPQSIFPSTTPPETSPAEVEDTDALRGTGDMTEDQIAYAHGAGQQTQHPPSRPTHLTTTTANRNPEKNGRARGGNEPPQRASTNRRRRRRAAVPQQQSAQRKATPIRLMADATASSATVPPRRHERQLRKKVEEKNRTDEGETRPGAPLFTPRREPAVDEPTPTQTDQRHAT